MEISFFGHDALYQTQVGRFDTAETAFAHFRERGARYTDIFTSNLADYPLTYYLKIVRGAGMDASSLISFEKIAADSPTDREKSIARVKEQTDDMEKYKIPMIMLAPQIEPCADRDEFYRRRELLVKGFSELCDYAAAAGVRLAMENQSLLTRPDSKTEDIAYIWECVPKLGYVLDTGNYFCIGEDVCAAYERFKDRTVHVHCKDWKWDDYGDFVREGLPRFRGCTLCEGDAKLRTVLRKLKANGYRGALTVEVNTNLMWNDFDRCFDHLKEFA